MSLSVLYVASDEFQSYKLTGHENNKTKPSPSSMDYRNIGDGWVFKRQEHNFKTWNWHFNSSSSAPYPQ